MEVKEPSVKYMVCPQSLAVTQADSGLPLDWRETTLGDLAKSIERGASPRPIDSPKWFDATSSIGWVRISDVTKSGRRLAQTSQQLSAAGVRASRYVPSGSLIMSICATVGRPVETDIDVCIHDGFVVFTEPLADQSFLYHLLKAQEPRWASTGQTGSQMNLNTDLIRRERVALPPEHEQVRIAKALTETDALIDSLEQLLTKKRQIKQGAMQELLTGKRRLPGFEKPWISRTFADVVIASRERVNPSALNTPPLCVELEHLESSTGRLSGDAFESKQAATKSVFRRGDVLFGKLRAYLRKYWLAEFDGVCSTEIWVLRSHGELGSNVYLFYTIQRDDFIEAASTAYGTHMPRSDWKIVSEFDLALPSDATEQAAIAQVLSDIDTELTTLESRLTKARALKQSMAQALLTGRIRIPLASQEPTA